MSHHPYQALYLHIPFCVRRCAYCDFTTRAVDAASLEIDDYIEGLCLQLRRKAREGELAHIQTVYLGGGTPSHVRMARLSMLLYTLSLSMRLEPDVECTMEANPESLDAAMVRDVWALGVNRLSIGVQSFDDEVLQVLGRAHDAARAREAVETAQGRFENVSVDLMCGIPGQSLASFEESVREAVRLGVAHVSIYPLTVEHGTPLFREALEGRFPWPDEDEQADHMEAAARILSEAGFERYEVASYARPGFACRHNRAYWSGVPYLGLGAGAATMTQNDGRRMRVVDGRVTDDLDAAQMAAEDLMLRMRMAEGAAAEDVRRACALLPRAQEAFEEVCALGLAELRDGRFRPTERGWLCGNELFGRILDLA